MLLSVLRLIRSLSAFDSRSVAQRRMAFHHMRMRRGEEDEERRGLGVFQTDGGVTRGAQIESADKRLLDLTHEGIIF